MIAFVVTDTGIGIAADNLNRIFEPFRRVDASVSRAYEGTGLGLAITKGLVELSGGYLAVQSEVGVGTTVTAWFPTAQEGALATCEGVVLQVALVVVSAALGDLATCGASPRRHLVLPFLMLGSATLLACFCYSHRGATNGPFHPSWRPR